MLKRLNKIASRSLQLNSIALIKRAGLATPGMAAGARAVKSMGVGGPLVGTMATGVGAISAVKKAKRVADENFDPAKRDLMLGTAKQG